MSGPTPEALADAVAALRRGGIVAFPSESSYGLAVDALDEQAIARLWRVKGRPAGQPPPLLVVGEEMLLRLVEAVPPEARSLMARFWPGPLTLALPARRDLPADLVLDGHVGVRESPHPTARALVLGFGGPLTATSANRSGEPPAMRADEVTLDGIDAVLDGGAAWGGLPSTVARVSADGRIAVLRRGPVDPLA